MSNAHVDKAAANNYRFMDETSCNSCCRKQAVPWFWCPEVDRQTQPHMTCDQHKAEVAS